MGIRQQSEALAKDEVDATLTRNNTIINQFKTDIENKLQNINITYESNVESLIAEQKSFSKELNAIKANLNETINGINSETANLSKHLNNFENGINVCQNKALIELKNNIGEQMSSIGVETKKQFEAYHAKERNLATTMESYEKSFETIDKTLNELQIESLAKTKTVEQNMNDLIGHVNEIDLRVNSLQESNSTNIEEIINMKEATFVQQEKVKFVDRLSARMDSFDEEKKENEANLIRNNEEMIAKNTTALKELQNILHLKVEKQQRFTTEKLEESEKLIQQLIEQMKDKLANSKKVTDEEIQLIKQVQEGQTDNINQLDKKIKQAENNIKDNNESINTNASLIQQNSNSINSLFVSISKQNEVIEEIKADLNEKVSEQNHKQQFEELEVSIGHLEETQKKTIEKVKQIDKFANNINETIKHFEVDVTKQKEDDIAGLNLKLSSIENEISSIFKNINEVNEKGNNISLNLSYFKESLNQQFQDQSKTDQKIIRDQESYKAVQEKILADIIELKNVEE